MRIMSWNVNGIRAVHKKGLLVPFIERYQPDVLCLQETKAEQHQSEVDLPGYQEYWNSAARKGYSGTAIFSKIAPLSVHTDIPAHIAKAHQLTDDLPAPRPGVYFVYAILCSDNSIYIGQTENIRKRFDEHKKGIASEHTAKYKPKKLIHYEEFSSRKDAVLREKKLKTGFGRKWVKREFEAGRTRQAGGYGDPNTEGRVIALEFAHCYVVSVYTPNAKDDLSRVALRHKHWDPAFLAYMRELETKKPVIFCGDLNVAHTPDDLARPKDNVGNKGFTDEERAGIDAVLAAGFVDTFRLFTSGNGHYTWWSHFAKARERNVGWRIDYIFVSATLKPKVTQAEILPEVLGSDHCPIAIDIDL